MKVTKPDQSSTKPGKNTICPIWVLRKWHIIKSSFVGHIVQSVRVLNAIARRFWKYSLYRLVGVLFLYYNVFNLTELFRNSSYANLLNCDCYSWPIFNKRLHGPDIHIQNDDLTKTSVCFEYGQENFLAFFHKGLCTAGFATFTSKIQLIYI